MGTRLELQSLFEALIESENVYHQPPASVVMAYPCIEYHLDNMDTEFADNIPYLMADRYQVTVMDHDPDSVIPKKVASLPRCIFSRRYIAKNLIHTVFTLYF